MSADPIADYNDKYLKAFVYVEKDGSIDLSGLGIQPGHWEIFSFPESRVITMIRLNEENNDVPADSRPDAQPLLDEGP